MSTSMATGIIRSKIAVLVFALTENQPLAAYDLSTQLRILNSPASRRFGPISAGRIRAYFGNYSNPRYLGYQPWYAGAEQYVFAYYGSQSISTDNWRSVQQAFAGTALTLAGLR